MRLTGSRLCRLAARPPVPWDPQRLNNHYSPLTAVSCQSSSLEPTNTISGVLQPLQTSLISGAQCWLEGIPNLFWKGFESPVQVNTNGFWAPAHSTILCSVLWGWTLQTTLPRLLCISLPMRGAGGRWTKVRRRRGGTIFQHLAEVSILQQPLASSTLCCFRLLCTPQWFQRQLVHVASAVKVQAVQ